MFSKPRLSVHHLITLSEATIAVITAIKSYYRYQIPVGVCLSVCPVSPPPILLNYFTQTAQLKLLPDSAAAASHQARTSAQQLPYPIANHIAVSGRAESVCIFIKQQRRRQRLSPFTKLAWSPLCTLA